MNTLMPAACAAVMGRALPAAPAGGRRLPGIESV